MLKNRILLALAVAVLGTGVFLALRAVLFGLLEPPLYIVGCFFGAFLSCLFLVAPRERRFAAWLVPASGICLITYIFIGFAHLINRAPSWDDTVPEEAGNVVVWAILATSWWLTPSVAAVLTGMTKILARKRSSCRG